MTDWRALYSIDVEMPRTLRATMCVVLRTIVDGSEHGGRSYRAYILYLLSIRNLVTGGFLVAALFSDSLDMDVMVQAFILNWPDELNALRVD